MFAADSVLAYLQRGEEGQLRVRQAKNSTVKSDKTTRTRTEALGFLAAAASLDAELPRLPVDRCAQNARKVVALSA